MNKDHINVLLGDRGDSGYRGAGYIGGVFHIGRSADSSKQIKESEMTQSTVTIKGLTDLANDLIIQNTAIKNKLDKVETQRDELLEALEIAKSWIDRWAPHISICSGGYECTCGRTRVLFDIANAIDKAKGEL